jgi:hypothetical protein
MCVKYDLVPHRKHFEDLILSRDYDTEQADPEHGGEGGAVGESGVAHRRNQCFTIGEGTGTELMSTSPSRSPRWENYSRLLSKDSWRTTAVSTAHEPALVPRNLRSQLEAEGSACGGEDGGSSSGNAGAADGAGGGGDSGGGGDGGGASGEGGAASLLDDYKKKTPSDGAATFEALVLDKLDGPSDGRPSGLRWRNVGRRKPQGEELTDDNIGRLKDELKRRTTFRQEEWDKLEVTKLRTDHFVEAGGCYFQPADEEHAERVELRKRLLWVFGGFLGLHEAVSLFYFAGRLTSYVSAGEWTWPWGWHTCPATETCNDLWVVLARLLYNSTIAKTPLVLGGLFVFECLLLDYDAEQLVRYVDVCEVRNKDTIGMVRHASIRMHARMELLALQPRVQHPMVAALCAWRRCSVCVAPQLIGLHPHGTPPTDTPSMGPLRS